MSASAARIASIKLPAFGQSSSTPVLSQCLYQARLDQVADRMAKAKLDFLLVFADREHCANLAYLTGFDPRFEEALLLLSAKGERKLLVGNECMGYLPDIEQLGLSVELFQEFSLMGQARTETRPLRKILRDFGIGRKAHVGCAGWKYFEGDLLGSAREALDSPAYLVDALRHLTGSSKHVVNATGLFMDVQDGLRVTNEPAQIAQFEFASTVTSQGVLHLIHHLEPGLSEAELEVHLETSGLPLSCHRMISFGDKAKRGLASPSDRRAQLGDTFTIGFGVQGALTCRAGVIASRSRQLSAGLQDFYPRLAANYFEVVATWYEALRVGATAASIVRAVERVRAKRLYKFAVNPGHYLHLDEWVHSPFRAGSPVTLRSGMMLQMDIIPVSQGPFCYSNAEDGVVLADELLQRQLETEFPELWRRIQTRRTFMTDILGINLHASVLPLSNIPAWLPPYALDWEKVFVL
jgi:Xaa-Pro aminopeptidase